MSVPQITFPIEQNQVKEIHDKLLKYYQSLQTDLHVTQELLRVIRTFCSHPNRRNDRCPDCGERELK